MLQNNFTDEQIILKIKKYPISFLKYLRASQIFEDEEFDKWRPIFDLYNLYHKISKDSKIPPKNYFRTFSKFYNDREKVKNLENNFRAIKSKYDKDDFFIHVDLIDNLLESYSANNEYGFVKISLLKFEENIRWDLNLLRKFKRALIIDESNCNSLINEKTNINLNFEIVAEFKNEIKWGSIVKFKELKWSFNELLSYKDYLVFNNRKEYSGAGTFEEFGISSNLEIEWTKELIEAFEESWNWKELCINPYIRWDIKLIEYFFYKIDFDSLSSNKYISWTIELIEAFEENWNWERLSGNPGLPWSFDLLKKYEDKWFWNVTYNCYTDTGTNGQEVKTNYEPSISTNTGILWDMRMIVNFKSKIDTWRLARRGILSLEVIKIIKEDLFRKEHTGWVFHEYSDFMTVTEKIYLTGWENLAKNELFILTPEIIDFLYKNNITLTYSVGNLNNEGKYETKEFRLLELFKKSKFNCFDTLSICFMSEHYCNYFLNNDFMNNEFWEMVFKVFTLQNKQIVFNLLSNKSSNIS